MCRILWKQVVSILLALFVCLVLAEKPESTTSSDASNKQPTEDRLLANIVRARDSSKVLHAGRNDSEASDKTADKRARTTIHGFQGSHGSPGSQSRDNSSCCGPRYNTNTSGRPDSQYHSSIRPIAFPNDGGRHPSSQYGDRVSSIDRYAWQTQSRPSGASGSAGKPFASGTYNGNYGGTYAGDRFGSRPSYGNEQSGRPGGFSPGGHGYGTHGSVRPHGPGTYGISGTLADGEDFGPGDPGYPEGNPPPSVPNLQNQKAIALKALAGVALIGAAAALATNPVLLPLGVVSGRRKRSDINVPDIDAQTQYVLSLLRNNFPKVYIQGKPTKVLMSPKCLARMTCEIQKSYLAELDRDIEIFKEDKNVRYHLSDMIRNNVLNSDSVNSSIKKLIRTGISVASAGGSCGVFACGFIKTG